jgi:hypothetical protein
MRRSWLRLAPSTVVVVLLLAVGLLALPAASTASSSAASAQTPMTLAASDTPATPQASPASAHATLPPASGTPASATPLPFSLEPTLAAALTATAIAYPTPDAEFAARLRPLLEAAYAAGASRDELVQVTLDAMAGRYRAIGGDVFALSDWGPIVVHGYWQEGGEWFLSEFLFWLDSDGHASSQSLDRAADRDLTMALVCPPQDARVGGLSTPEIQVVPCGAAMGQDWGGGYYLLRLENGAWRVVWSYEDAVRVGQWATRRAQVQFVDGMDAVLLVGALPEAESVPRFFDETTHHAAQQTFVSLWQRVGDAYVRVSGQIVETPMRAMTEFMAGLKQGDQAPALARAADASIVGEALAKGWGTLIGSSLMAWPADGQREGAIEQTLEFGPPDTWGGAYRAPYRVQLVMRDGRWLVAGVENIRPGTPRPAATPELTVTSESTSATGG